MAKKKGSAVTDAAKKLGKRGGLARKQTTSEGRRKEIAAMGGRASTGNRKKRK